MITIFHDIIYRIKTGIKTLSKLPKLGGWFVSIVVENKSSILTNN